MRYNTFTFRLNAFLIGLTGLSIFAWIVNNISPKEGSVILTCIALISVIIFFFLASFIKNVRRCFIWSSGVGVLLFLRYIHLRDPLYIILLIALIGSIELAFKNR